MSVSELRERFRGVFGFPITPFRKDLSVDLDALARNVDEMARHPFCAMVAAGGTGEVYSLTPEEIASVVRVTVEATAGRMPVVAGTGFSAVLGSDIARREEKAGADCLLVLPPYYSHAPEIGLVEYYATIGRATGLPLMLYSRDWAAFTPHQVAKLADHVPTLAFWKDGQGDARKLQRIMNYCGDRLAWLGGMGDDCVPAYFAVGVQAYTSSISNIAPRLSLALADAGLKRDFGRLNELMRKYVHPLYALRERSKGYEVSVMKAAMEILGIPAGPVRPPLHDCTARDVEDVRKLMEVYQDVVDPRESGKGAERSTVGAGRDS
ncbi:MAG TPA: 5-dehydro-4-deoxyglucarate dehydratase [Bryobacteraceae bacterium]|jgi:5-dehydro-4-deoxyglucarate dehydratase|nr:5-dehydro-4-deoxyglucarate dehydratase [Bryobacteraceae bacterium]